jgi:GTPase SAR1 family protein
MSKQGQIKVIVLGDSGVGKSSILLRFVNDEFNEFNDPTLGAAFLSKVHNYGSGQSVRLQVYFALNADVGHSRPREVQIDRSHLLQR